MTDPPLDELVASTKSLLIELVALTERVELWMCSLVTFSGLKMSWKRKK